LNRGKAALLSYLKDYTYLQHNSELFLCVIKTKSVTEDDNSFKQVLIILDRPSVAGFLHMGMGTDYHCEPDETVLGIPCRKFTANVTYESIGAHLAITYHWSSKLKLLDNLIFNFFF